MLSLLAFEAKSVSSWDCSDVAEWLRAGGPSTQYDEEDEARNGWRKRLSRDYSQLFEEINGNQCDY